MKKLTHIELVLIAKRWLSNTFHCRVILTELVAYTKSMETPDVIGWVNGRCILVECKTSRSDFKADQKKLSRTGRIKGLGHWRFYLTEFGLLDGLEIPQKWGLYEIKGKRIYYNRGQKHTNAGIVPCVSCKDSEIALLVSALARADNKTLNPTQTQAPRP